MRALIKESKRESNTFPLRDVPRSEIVLALKQHLLHNFAEELELAHDRSYEFGILRRKSQVGDSKRPGAHNSVLPGKVRLGQPLGVSLLSPDQAAGQEC